MRFTDQNGDNFEKWMTVPLNIIDDSTCSGRFSPGTINEKRSPIEACDFDILMSRRNLDNGAWWRKASCSWERGDLLPLPFWMFRVEKNVISLCTLQFIFSPVTALDRLRRLQMSFSLVAGWRSWIINWGMVLPSMAFASFLQIDKSS